VPHETTFALTADEPGALVSVSGRLDVVVAADARLALADAVDRGTGGLVLDLAGLQGIDATGLGVLVGAHRHAGRAGRTLVLRDPQPQIARLLLITRLDRVLHVVRTAALA
jgi:anti-anti-sigma factor